MPLKKVVLLKEPRYLTAEDVFMRLHDCLVKFKGIPYRATTKNKEVFLHSLVDAKIFLTVNANSTELDITSIEPGYVNFEGGVFCISRTPARKQKQGTSVVNTVMYALGDFLAAPVSSATLFSKEVHDAIMGIYPSYQNISKFSKQVALSSKVALKKTDVYFEQSLIGNIMEDRSVKLLPAYSDSLIIMTLAGLGIGVY